MSHPFDDAIAQLIQARKALGLSQTALEARIGCSEGLVAKWESRRRSPSLPSLVDWARALGHEVTVGGTAGPVFEKATQHFETMKDLHSVGLRMKINPVLSAQDRVGIDALKNAESLLAQALTTVRAMIGPGSS